MYVVPRGIPGSESVGPSGASIPDRRLGWHQQFSLWCAKRLSMGRLDDQWDALHERVQPPLVENYLIFSHRTSLSVSLVLYTSLS